MNITHLPTRIFGHTGQPVTIVGLGGEGILRTYGQSEDSQSVIHEALNQGITYFDSARAYAGSEAYYGSFWSRNQDTRSRLFQASKSASRDKKTALLDLEKTLRTMGVSYLNLWQIHDVRTEEDLKLIGGPGGALEAFIEEKERGKVHSIGVTGHHDPKILTKAVKDWPVDSVMMPVNPVEGAIGGFLDMTLPLAREKGLAVIGMKVLGASHYIIPDLGVTAETLIQYALSQDISVAILGCSSKEEVKLLAKAGRDFTPLSTNEQRIIVDRFRPYAKGLAYYRGVK